MALSVEQLIAADRMIPLRDAIVAGLASQFEGIRVIAHPGKIDIYDVVKRAVVAAPGVALGWSRVQAPREVDGSYVTPIDWAAYIVAEDYADLTGRRRVARDVVAHAIGSHLLRVLHDPDLSSWGLARVTPPAGNPGPQLKPMFTATAYEKGTAYYAVTWTQGLIDLGADFLGGETPAFVLPDTDDPRPGLKFENEDAIPAEIQALIDQADQGGNP
jgi:hypothetical protein